MNHVFNCIDDNEFCTLMLDLKENASTAEHIDEQILNLVIKTRNTILLNIKTMDDLKAYIDQLVKLLNREINFGLEKEFFHMQFFIKLLHELETIMDFSEKFNYKQSA